MVEEVYFAKSSEEDFYTKMLKGKRKVNFQSIPDMVKKKIIKPNTMSFGRRNILSTTILHKNYLKTYRPQGLIFKTKMNPAYMAPLDFVILSSAKKIIVHYYRIKNNLHLYYNHKLIKGFEKFLFKKFKSMIHKFPSPKPVWIAVNKFRVAHGFSRLTKQKYRLVEYNEVVFDKPIKIEPVAIFGYRKESRMLAKKLGLPHYRSAKEFYRIFIKGKKS